MTSIYHVGLLKVGRTAVFQYRRSVDNLDCEILQYFGERETTKAGARARLKETRAAVLALVRRDYPTKRFDYVRVD